MLRSIRVRWTTPSGSGGGENTPRARQPCRHLRRHRARQLGRQPDDSGDTTLDARQFGRQHDHPDDSALDSPADNATTPATPHSTAWAISLGLDGRIVETPHMPAQAPTTQLAPADVLIVTALREERDAVKAVMTGALGDSWVVERAPNTELRIERRSFSASDRGKLHVALICAEDMGGTQTAGVAGPVVMALRPRCLAMCGVLAGKPDDTEFGDVIFADQLFLHDSGKRKETSFEHATRPHKLDIRWLEKARDFAEDPGDALAWLKGPDWTEEQQRAWLLDQFSRGRNSRSLGKLIEECCPGYESIIGRLLEEELVRPEEDPLTEKGKRNVATEQFKSPRWPGLDPPRRSLRVHVGPIASGNAVQADPVLWKELAVFARKTLGVEMEAHAVGNTAELHQVELAVVMKGVMDHADKHKDDRYKRFAARASAECLLAFLRKYLPSQVRPDYDDILSSGTADLPTDPSPSQLLMPTYQVVQFYKPGRTAELADLEAWCTTGGDVRGRLIHGPGGYGKTRLAIEWTRILREQEWAAGFLRAGAAADWFARLLALGMPVAVVIDYAESHAGLRGLLEPVLRYTQAEGAKTRVRVLLLARGVGDWWDALVASDDVLREFFLEISPVVIEPLAEVSGDRVEVFRAAVRDFAAKRKRPTPGDLPDDLADSSFDRVLYLHMAALALVDSLDFRSPRPGRTTEEEMLMDAILQHEERFWDERQIRNDRTRRIQIEQARLLVVAATLRGGLPTREVATAVAASVLGAAHEPLVMLLHDIYGASGHGGHAVAYLGPLEPDLLGEGMVRRVYDRVNERPANIVERVFADDDADAIRIGFVVLGRVSSGNGPGVRPWIDHLLATKLETRALLAFEAAKVVGKRTAYSELGEALVDALQRNGDANLAKIIERSGIREKTVVLRRVGVWVYQTLLNALPDAQDEEILRTRARLVNNLGLMQSAVGHWDAALASAGEAVRIYGELAKKDPDVFEPELALSMNNLGNAQGVVGQWDAAIVSAREAVRIYGELARRNPDRFERDLALSLSNLSNRQSAVGQRDAALKSAEEAVRINGELAAKGDPVAFEPELARNLTNLSLRQSEAGQSEVALASAAEAVRIYSELARRNPDAFESGLAFCLNTLGTMQGRAGQWEAALRSTDEAVRIRRALATKFPDAFEPDLALSLNHLSVIQGTIGQREAALASVEDAVRIRRALVKKNPDAYEPDLASSLNNLATLQSTIGQREAALASAREAFELYWRAFQGRPEVFDRNMSITLKNLLIRLGETSVGPDEILPPPLSPLAPGRPLPVALLDIIDRCLRKSRDERFQNMRKVEAALSTLLAEQDPPLAGPTAPASLPPSASSPESTDASTQVHATLRRVDALALAADPSQPALLTTRYPAAHEFAPPRLAPAAPPTLAPDDSLVIPRHRFGAVTSGDPPSVAPPADPQLTAQPSPQAEMTPEPGPPTHAPDLLQQPGSRSARRRLLMIALVAVSLLALLPVLRGPSELEPASPTARAAVHPPEREPASPPVGATVHRPPELPASPDPGSVASSTPAPPDSHADPQWPVPALDDPPLSDAPPLVQTLELPPQVAPPPLSAPRPPSPRRASPRSLEEKSRRCRREHAGTSLPPIDVVYTLSNGKVLRARTITTVSPALASCLEDVLRNTPFPLDEFGVDKHIFF